MVGVASGRGLVKLDGNEERHRLVGGVVVDIEAVVGGLAVYKVLLPLDGDGCSQGFAIEEIDEELVAGFDGGRHFGESVVVGVEEVQRSVRKVGAACGIWRSLDVDDDEKRVGL